MIRVISQSYQYPGSSRISFPDFHLAKGKHGLLLGDSGSGKTTLIHLIGGLLRAQEGRIEINGTDLASLKEHSLDLYRGQHFGFVFQKNHLMQALSVEKNLLAAPFFAGLPQQPERVDVLLSELGLDGKRHSKISELSQGQAQRVAIARALLNRPSVILADEPTSALDDKNCEKVIELLLQASSSHGATLIVATHDQRLKSKISNCVQL